MTARCRICRCSQLAPCVGADGAPCHWAEPGLCSECVGAACFPANDPGAAEIVVYGGIEEQALMAEMRRMILGPRMPDFGGRA